MINKLTLIGIFLLGNLVYAQIPNFNFFHHLENVQENGWHQIEIPDNIFSDVRTDFSDARIYQISSSDTIETPYFIEINTPQIIQKSIQFDWINKNKQDNNQFYTFDCKEITSLNKIDLNFKNTNFEYFVKLEGSNDLLNWFVITNNYRIVNVSNAYTKYNFTELNFTTSKYRYFRISFTSNNNSNLYNASIFKTDSIKGDFIKCTIENVKKLVNKTTKQSIVELNLKNKSLVYNVELNVNFDGDYYREITIEYLKDSLKTPKGWVYNYLTAYKGILNSFEKAKFTLQNCVSKQLKITIDNQDNPALNIKDIKVNRLKYYLVSNLKSKQNYIFCYGNTQINSPQYDIVNFKNKIAPNLSTTAKMGNQKLFSNSKAHNLSPMFSNKIILWVIIILICGTLAYFSYKMLKS